jgi:PTS system fructose-specific IIC component/PTS system nitrogen regulatory IIA component
MLLSEVFTRDLIKAPLEAEDKDEVFEELVDIFCSARHSDAREEILESLRQREAEMSTGIQTGVAIPHCKVESLGTIHGILGVSRKGIDYDALDDKPVHLVFMLLLPERNDQHLKVLSNLAALLQNPQFYTDMYAQKDADGIFRTLKSYEDHVIDVV